MTRSQLLAIALTASLAALAIAFVAPASAVVPPDCNPGDNKCFAADISPHSVAGGTIDQEFTLTLTNESPISTTQKLGSVNLTPPPGFTAKSINLPGCSTPIGMSGATCGDVVLNVVQIRNINLQPVPPPNNSVSFTLKADVPNDCKDHLWTIKGRQSNNFQGAKNDFTLDQDPPTNLKTTVTGCGPAPAPDFTIQFVDADANTAGVQRDAPDPVTSAGIVTLKASIDNTGTGAGTATYVHSATNGATIALIGARTGETNPCTSTSGVNTATATCSLGSIAPSDPPVVVLIDVKAQTLPEGSTTSSSTTHTGEVQENNATDTEMTTVDPAVNKCIDPVTGHSYDCVKTWYEPQLGLDVSTGTPTQENPLAGSLHIDPSNLGTPRQLIYTESFSGTTCGGKCSGDINFGNVLEHFVLPEACGLRLCTLKDSYAPRLIPDGNPLTAILIGVGSYEDDFGNRMNIGRGCTGNVHICEPARDIVGNTVVFTILASAGDGRTGYCLGSVCP